MENLQEYFDRGVLHPGHPPVLEPGTFGQLDRALSAGTVLKLSGGKWEPAAEADTPAGVLLEDVAAHTEDVRAFVLRHGIAVRSRLTDGSAAAEKAASDTLAGKLPACGIYLTQGGWTDSDFA